MILNMDTLSLWTFVFLTTISGAISQSGTYFVYENTVYASYSSWIVSYSVDMEPYRSHLRKIHQEIVAFSSEAETLIREPTQKQYNLHETVYIRQEIVKLLQEESRQFYEEYDSLEDLLNNILTFTVDSQATILPGQTREKRSALLPVVGDLLSALFGVATQENAERVREGLLNLNNRQNQMSDVLSKSIHLMNRTNEQVQINRNALKRIANVTAEIQNEIQKFYNDLYFELYPEFLYVHLISRLQALFNLVSSTIRQMHLTLTSLLVQLQSSVQGDLSPSLIHPVDLFNVLSTIKSKLPSGVELPYSLNREGLQLYYQYLKPMVIPAADSFYVIMAVPLIHKNTEYEINRAVQVPVAHSNTSFGARYALETEYFAISRDRNHFIPLDLSEAVPCLSGPICQFTRPEFSIVNYPLCVTSLFLHDSPRTSKFCKKVITPMNKPEVNYLFPRHWLISTPYPFKLTWSCAGENRDSDASGIEIIKLEDGCSVSSSYFSLPIQTSGKISAEQEVKFGAEIEIAKLSKNIWNHTKSLPAIFSGKNVVPTDLTSELPKIQDIPVEYLHSLLDQRSVRTPDKVSPPRSFAIPLVSVSMCLSIIPLVLIILFVCVRRYRKPKNRNMPKVIYQARRSSQTSATAKVTNEMGGTEFPLDPLESAPLNTNEPLSLGV